MTETEYNKLRTKINRYDCEARQRFTQSSGCVVIPLSEKPTLPPEPTNEERAACEVYEFLRDKPDKYFCYVNEERNEVTTWTGVKLGTVSFGYPYRDNFGGERTPVTVRAINGVRYHGTYYHGMSGNYARLKAYREENTCP
jgi:hypothetical protein